MPFEIGPTRRRLAPALVFVAVLAVRAAYWAGLEGSPLSFWHLWTQTDEWGYVDWSAHLARGNWLDVPAWRSYFGWQVPYGPPEVWEGWYAHEAYFAGPLYPYGLALIRLAGLPLLPSVRLFQLLLASLAAAVIAAAVQDVSRRFLLEGEEGEGRAPGLAAAPMGPAFAGLVAGLAYGLYGPLLFQDGFAYRDGPVTHVSALLLAFPLLKGWKEGEKREGKAIEGEGNPAGSSSRGRGAAFLLGLLGGLATLLKQTLLPLAVVSLFLFLPSRKSFVGVPRRRAVALSILGLAIPLLFLVCRNLAVGAPALTFDTRQSIGLAWGNGRGADATTAPPETMKEILVEARGSTGRTAWLVLKGYSDAPWELPALWGKKLLTFFLGYEVPDNSNYYFFRDRLGLLKALPVFPCLVGIGIVGLLAARTRGALRREEGWLVAIAILVPLGACLLVQTTARYRVGVVPPLALGAGLLAFLSFEEWRVRSRRVVFSWASVALVLSAASAFLPSPIPTPRHRYADAIVAATLAESSEGPEEGAAEIRRYLAEATDDSGRAVGETAAKVWLSGERRFTAVAPEGVAPPSRRYSVPRE